MRHATDISARSPLALLWAANAFAWSFAVCGDSRDDRDGIFPQILAAVDNSDMEFLLHTGDMVNKDSPGEWDAISRGDGTVPETAARGDREPRALRRRDTRRSSRRDSASPEPPGPSPTRTPTSRSWTTRRGRSRTTPSRGSTATSPPTRRERAGSRPSSWRCTSPRHTDGIRPHGTRFDYEERSAKLLAILKRHGVDAVLSGHEHMQHVEDWEGVLLLVSGGAGAPLAPFQKYGYYRIDVENGRVRESFRRVRPGQESPLTKIASAQGRSPRPPERAP